MSVKLRKKKLASGKYSIYLDLYSNGKRHYEFLELYLHNTPRKSEEKDQNKETLKLAQEILLKRQHEISANNNEIPLRKKPKEVKELFENVMKRLKDRGKESYWEVHKFTLRSLEKFTVQKYGAKNISFQDITYPFLKEYESFLFKIGCTAGGISVYMRTLRTIYNEAIKEGFVNSSSYPFSTPQNKGYSIAKLKSKPNPKALSVEDMEKFKVFPLNNYPRLKNSVNYFLFSYYSRGMNFRDMVNLKWTDIYNGRINYTRLKTGGFFSIKVSENLEQILNQYDKNSSFIFPILNETHKTPSQQQNRIKKCLKAYNKDLKEIGDILSIKVKITSYVARHTYANTLKHKGADINIISESMGHQNVNTTKNYLKQFSDDVIDSTDNLL